MSTITLMTEWPVEGGPDGIAVSPDGEVFVTINGNYRIEKATYEGDTSGQPWYIKVECKPY